jgi:hypothetical protein
VKNAAEAHVVITFVCQQSLHIVMYLQSVINGEMDAVVAEVGVTMCAEVHMFVKSTTPRHAQSCKGKSSSEDRGHDGPLCCCVYNIIPFVLLLAVVLTSFI